MLLANKKTNLKVWLLVVLAAVTLTAQAGNEPVQDMAGQSIQTISFKKDMPIKDALSMLGQMYEKNIVPSAKVDGIVTVNNLYDVTFEEALQAILGTHKYEIKGNFIKIYTNEEFMADKSRFEHAIITLFYISSAEAQKLAEPLISENGRLGVTTAAPATAEPGEGADSLAIHDRLVVSDYPENIESIREVLTEVDVKPLQVLIEVTVMKAQLTEDLQFGIDWSSIPGLDVSLTQSGVSSESTTGILTGGLSAGISIDSFSAFVRAKEGVSDLTLVANPKILALNKQAGKLIIGNQDGYLTLTNTNTDGATQQVEFLESGTVLEFRPFIGKDGMIRMELHPEQSSGSVVSGLPEKTTTEILTNVMVKDNQTIVLGGLFQEETNLGRTQTPLLGDVPVAGNMFKNIDDESIRTELIVLITPHIIDDPEQADGADRLEDVYRLARGARENIHWLSRARIAEEQYVKAAQAYTDGDYEAALSSLNKPYIFKPRNDLDFIRLRESIVRKTQPEAVDQIERIMLIKLEKEESGKWMRR
jgi:type II secretory pathway component GspD/PulD (secretin)